MNKFLKIIHFPGLAMILAVMGLSLVKPALRRTAAATTRSGEAVL